MACTQLNLLVIFQTTFILKRRKGPHLGKSHKPVGDKKLKARHFLYDLVEDTNIRKKEPIKLILKTSVEGKSLHCERFNDVSVF